MNIRNYLLQHGIRKKELIGIGIFLSSIAVIMVFTGRNNQQKKFAFKKIVPLHHLCYNWYGKES